MHIDRNTMAQFPMKRLISGGQTGVDTAALEVALRLGIPMGGWCPAGRRQETGTIPGLFPLRETPSRLYPVRTRWNVRDADATLIVIDGSNSRGTRLTRECAGTLGKPLLVLDLSEDDEEVAAVKLLAWLTKVGPATLNVAGPRHSESPQLGPRVSSLLIACLCADTTGPPPPWPPRRPYTRILRFG